MKQLFILICLLGSVAAALHAQPLNRSTYETMLKTAEEKLAAKDYYNALEWYEKCYDERKEKEMGFKIAQLHFELRDYVAAEKWFGRASKIRKNPFPEARLMFAKMQKMNGKYPEAVEELQQFIADSQDEKLKKIAERELEGARLATKLLEPNDMKIANAGANVNTPASDYSPALLNANDMYFAALTGDKPVTLDGKEGNYQSKIYTASRSTGGGWSKAELLSAEINREGFHTGNPSFSPDGKRMFFNRSILNGNVLGESEIYMSKKTPDGWAPPLKVEGVNGKYIAKHPMVGELFGKEVLFFVSDMEGGHGGFDVYYATYQGEDKYDLPVNLGTVVNTPDDEATPFYRDGKLFFSSNGLPSLGGFDIYFSSWNGATWSKPTNMGKGYNSGADDLYYTSDKDGYNGLFVSNRVGGKSLKSKTCCDDIYTFAVDRIKANFAGTTFEKGKPLNGVAMQLIEMEGGKPGKTENQSNPTSNAFAYVLGLEKAYMVITSKAGYYPDTIQFNTTNIKKTITIDKKITLRPVPPPPPPPPAPKETEEVVSTNQPIRLNNIYYDYDDDKILPDAMGDLNYLDTLMKQYPDMVIELSSHTDARGNDKYNLELSQRRAESAKKYLVGNGIVDSRIQAVGYGETQILNDCKNGIKCADEQHRLNRRTEFKILSGPTSILIKKIVKTKVEGKPIEGKKPKGGPNPNFSNTGDSAKPKAVKLDFDKKLVDFGKIKKGEKREHSFTFTNKGDETVEIELCSACECTTLEWTRLPIAPGKTGKIDAIFDSKDKDASETIDITIILKNTDPIMHYPVVEEVKFKYELVK